MTPTPEPTPAVEALRRAWENRRDLGEYAGVPFADMLAAHDAQVAEKAVHTRGETWYEPEQGCVSDEDDLIPDGCQECHVPWPCATSAAIAGATDGND